MRAADDKIVMLTAYDSSFAALLDYCGVEVILVGDSLGNVMQGQQTTLPVTLPHHGLSHGMRGARQPDRAAGVGPAVRHHGTPTQAFESAAALMRAGAQMVKLEGGDWLAPTVKFLVERSIPVCAHIGLTPQSVHALGGFKVQGKTDARRRAAQARRAGAAGRRCAADRHGSRAGRAGWRGHGAVDDSDHRHRRRRGLLGPGAGAAGHAQYLSGPQGQVRAATSWTARLRSRLPCARTSPP